MTGANAIELQMKENINGIPSMPLAMHGIDCAPSQLEVIKIIWPVFSNSRVSNEYILDTSEFKQCDIHRLGCILMQSVEEIVGGYILIVIN